MPLSLLKENQVQKEFLEHVFEGLPDLMLITDNQGRIEASNGAIRTMFGFEPDKIGGVHLAAIIGSTHWAAIEPLLQISDKDMRAQQLKLGRRITGIRKDTTIFPISINVAEFQRNNEICFIFVVRDITKILNTELELERSNQDLQSFAAIASHDLQAPLRTVTTFAKSILAKQESILDDDARNKLQRILNACWRMKDLTDNLLDLARVDRKEKQFTTVSVNTAFDEVARDLCSLIAEAGATVSRSELPCVHGDQAQIRQVIQNLVTNALKFRKPGVAPVVNVSAELLAGNYWKFSVSDNGIGIAETDHAKIFGMFQRLHGRSEYPGSGIGLAMVKKIVEMHGGKVGLNSRLGEDTCFWFTLEAGKNIRHCHKPA